MPTKVTLPIPFYLQVDGWTVSNREHLLDPDGNNWNQFLLGKLPGFLLKSILEMRKNPDLADKIPHFIPISAGTDQLQTVFDSLISNLKNAAWIKTLNDKKTDWTTPDQVIQLDDFWIPWFEKYPDLRNSAEEKIGKKFVHPIWTRLTRWKSLREYYQIPIITGKQIATVIAGCPLPSEFTRDEKLLIEFYQYIISVLNSASYVSKNDIRALLLQAEIFPLERKKFGPLQTENDHEKIYWLSERNPRKTGLDDIENYRIINSEYTYKPKIGSDISDERRNALNFIDERNKIVRDLLQGLGIPELDDKQILSDLQIPWLLDKKRADDGEYSRLFNLLAILFDTFRAKRTKRDDPEYLNELSKLSDALLPSSTGKLQPLNNLILPEELRLESSDDLYIEIGLEPLLFPKKLLELSTKKDNSNTPALEDEKKLTKLKEDLRSFLLICGIKNKPKFNRVSSHYDNSDHFNKVDKERSDIWKSVIHNWYTPCHSVTITIIEIDNPTRKIINKLSGKSVLLSDLLFSGWREHFGTIFQKRLRDDKQNLMPGHFFIEYTYYKGRQITINDIFWAGINREKVPLTTIDNKPTTAGLARRISASQCQQLKKVHQFIPIVSDSPDLDKNYHEKYLESLNVQKLSDDDFNALWKKLNTAQFPDIIQIIIECLTNKVIEGNSLKIFDNVENRLRPANEFYLGQEAPEGIPLIERQYGIDGHKLGILLNLQIANEAQSFIGIFNKLLKKKIGVHDIKKEDKIHQVFKKWRTLDKTGKDLIKEDFQRCLTDHGLSQAPFVTINNPVLAEALKATKCLIFSFETDDEDTHIFITAARELGFLLPEDLGELRIEGEIPLNDSEIYEFNNIVTALLNYYNSDEKAVFYDNIQKMGDVPFWGQKIRKTHGVHKVIKTKNEVIVPIKTPFFSEEKHQLFVDDNLNVQQILTDMLVFFKIGLKRWIKRDIKDAISTHVSQKEFGAGESVSKGKVKSLPDLGTTPEDVGNQVRKALAFVPQSSEIKENDGSWKIGISPDEEMRFREHYGDQLIKSLKDGPEIHRKKVRSSKPKTRPYELDDNEKLVDPDTIDPKIYLKNEYNGQCQICGISLPLSNGENYFEIFRILEPQDGIWYYDRPFNILSLCPNCHALAKYGGRDFENIFSFAKLVLNGDEFPREVPEYRGDYYVIPVKLNGKGRKLVMSKPHMNEFVVLNSSSSLIEKPLR